MVVRAVTAPGGSRIRPSRVTPAHEQPGEESDEKVATVKETIQICAPCTHRELGTEAHQLTPHRILIWQPCARAISRRQERRGARGWFRMVRALAGVGREGVASDGRRLTDGHSDGAQSRALTRAVVSRTKAVVVLCVLALVGCLPQA